MNAPVWYQIFGEEAKGKSPEERAKTSTVRFVRSQDELALWNSLSQGRVFKAKEALERFGAIRLQQVWEEGSAILPPTAMEPAKTLRERREALGLTQDELARYTKVPVGTIARAESPDYTNNIHDLARLSMALGLDEAVLGFEPGARGDTPIAVRLKAWRHNNPTSARPVVTLSEATWIIATQNRFQRLLYPNTNPLAGFSPSYNYGGNSYPVWEQADYLAQETRRLLDFSTREPIASLRDVCHRLRVAFIRTELPVHIAGATLSTGDERGIVVNSSENTNNVWVQRATVAHELGHLLWDPKDKLDTLRVDNVEQIEKVVYESPPPDYVEARANAFAVELLAPKAAIRERTGKLDLSDYEAIRAAIRDNMVHFGLSATAMRYHLWNAYGKGFDHTRVPFITPEPTEEWRSREQFTDDYFPLNDTPLSRRGEFAGLVVRAEQADWLAPEAAAFYLNASVEDYQQHAGEILTLFPE